MLSRRSRSQPNPPGAAIADELRTVSERLVAAARAGDAPAVSEPLRALNDAAVAVGKAWSGSPIGYHSRVYYDELTEPPPGAHFSSEWGFQSAYSNPTLGDWREYRYDDVVTE